MVFTTEVIRVIRATCVGPTRPSQFGCGRCVLRLQGTKPISEALSEQRSTSLVTDGVPEPGIGGCNEPGPFPLVFWTDEHMVRCRWRSWGPGIRGSDRPAHRTIRRRRAGDLRMLACLVPLQTIHIISLLWTPGPLPRLISISTSIWLSGESRAAVLWRLSSA
jgi:hypothetical protein